MAKVKTIVAICYDFDGTLSPKNMQEYGFFMGLKPNERKEFWRESNTMAETKGADPILTYMYSMLKKAEGAGGALGTRRSDFRDYGKDIEFFPGVEEWFSRIKDYAKSQGLELRHYIISSGLKEMIEGSKIGHHFEQVYACSFIYGLNDAAEWPAQVVNFTTKTQYLFRINKGKENISDTRSVNAYVSPEERPVPFTNIIYLGDGETDVPCMRLVKEQGGNSIAVYAKGKKVALDTAKKLYENGRVNHVVQADYSENKDLDKLVKRIIDSIATQARLKDTSKTLIRKHQKKQLEVEGVFYELVKD